ncbi:MAG TPA: hypothetical protein PLV45_11790 [bacterium]|nr:hypothetical protein [bacterium]
MKKSDGRRTLPDLPEWEYGTWRGAQYLSLKRSASLTFRQRLEWLEDASRLVRSLRKCSRR